MQKQEEEDTSAASQKTTANTACQAHSSFSILHSSFNSFSMKNYALLSEKNREQAREILRKTNVIGIWESFGAEVNPVGSFRLGLMGRNLDIDLHVYTEPFSLADSFAAVGKLAEHPFVKRITFANSLHTEEQCVEWHIQLEDTDGTAWKMDIIHLVRGSRFDGYFEEVAERISALLTEETRYAILKLKFETPEDCPIMGIEYYRAVLEGGVRTFDEFTRWREANPVTGVLEWKP